MPATNWLMSQLASLVWLVMVLAQNRNFLSERRLWFTLDDFPLSLMTFLTSELPL